MSYSMRVTSSDVRCVIPLSDMEWLIREFKEVKISKSNIKLIYEDEEDDYGIEGHFDGDVIVLNSNQYGSFSQSSDGGLEMLLEKYKGNAIIESVGEDGDNVGICKYLNGIRKKGKVVFDD